jgi:quinol monooxygenase YgiN
MPVAVVQDWVDDETERSTTNYDAVSERLQAQPGPPAGLLVHTAGFTGNGFRIFEVWESREAFQRFLEDRLMPIVQEIAPDDDRQPDTTIYELHDFVAAPQ